MVERWAQQPEAEEPGINVMDARRFLAALGGRSGAAFCFQTYDDNPKKDERRGYLSGHRTCTFNEAQAWLVDHNRQNAAVLVAVNETDGRGREGSNITKARALLLDLDGKPLAAVKECAIEPHIITETSPGRYHVLWLVEGLSLDDWEDAQRGLAKRFDGDPSVATRERCTRLPGFFHTKDIDNPFRVRIVHTAAKDKRKPYTADEVKKEFPPEKKPHKAPKSLLVLPPNAPLVAAEKFVELYHTTADGAPKLWAYRGAFYVWVGTHWREYPEANLKRDLYTFLHKACVDTPKGYAPYNPNRRKIADVVDALQNCQMIPAIAETPFWITKWGDYVPTSGPYEQADRNLVACRNGILNLETRELIPHDPRFFTTHCMPLDYDPNASEPERWFQFLAEVWPANKAGEYDKEAERTLQEIVGYLLSSDTRQQKLFLIKGPKRAGKGTVVFVIEQLIGRENATYQTLSALTGEFGRWPLIDKKVAIIADARLGARNTAAVTETLLSISGGDPQTVNRKNQPFWTGRLAVRFLITTNELPELRDASRTIASRFILLNLEQSFYGKEDIDLKKKLMPELPGILNWALAGFDRLRKRGHFCQPASSAETLELLEDLASPVGAFVRIRCVLGRQHSVRTKELYRAYRGWAEENGAKMIASNTFGKELRDCVPKLRYSGVGASRKYVGIGVQNEDE